MKIESNEFTGRKIVLPKRAVNEEDLTIEIVEEDRVDFSSVIYLSFEYDKPTEEDPEDLIAEIETKFGIGRMKIVDYTEIGFIVSVRNRNEEERILNEIRNDDEFKKLTGEEFVSISIRINDEDEDPEPIIQTIVKRYSERYPKFPIGYEYINDSDTITVFIPRDFYGYDSERFDPSTGKLRTE